ncbi:MAG TPA: SGNH/GDSL hydrolase family protein [Steroidobacteraceae bacterium]|nr:SGNH/GDSL hydrolase family protein [Steroidobacteraceae bacterium]
MKTSQIAAHLSLFIGALATGHAWAQERTGAPALALGDSVVFGYITQAGHEYVNAANFIGAPEYIGPRLHLDTVNASCPGETTGSFLSAAAPDNGCREFRAAFPLHVSYGGTQMDFAVRFLRQHPATRLVSIGLGANDLFLLQTGCEADPNPSACIQAGLPMVLAEAATNLGNILADLRGTGYDGTIIVSNYYSPDYSDANETAITGALNQVLGRTAAAFGASIADVFSAFRAAVATPALGGKTCNSGLLNVNPELQSACDVHPSQSGQRLIAQTVMAAYFRSGGHTND